VPGTVKEPGWKLATSRVFTVPGTVKNGELELLAVLEERDPDPHADSIAAVPHRGDLPSPPRATWRERHTVVCREYVPRGGGLAA
jgi:hypothetical protein